MTAYSKTHIKLDCSDNFLKNLYLHLIFSCQILHGDDSSDYIETLADQFLHRNN